MRTQAGVVIGVVKTVNPSEGTVELEFPWLGASIRSASASIITPLAGKKRGLFFMPEVDDECLVAFENGDFNHPYVLGFLWNGVDVSPEDTVKNRIILTPGGHTLRFEDQDGAKKIILKSNSGHELDFDDRPGQAKITLTTQGQNKVVLNDQQRSITLTTAGQQQLQLLDTPGSLTLKLSSGAQISIDQSGITVSAPSGTLNITCQQANLTASSLLNVSAPLATFSGVVQASLVQATTVVGTTVVGTTVVGSTYTPGVGNLI